MAVTTMPHVTQQPHDHRLILTISCPDRVGIVAAVSALIASWKGWILEASYHADDDSKWFFMRNEILASSLPFGAAEFRERFAELAARFDMTWNLSDTSLPRRVVILVSKQDHCLSDLLHRWRSGEMSFDLRCVISNHDDLRSFVQWHRVPYHHVPVSPANKADAFAQVRNIIEQEQAETIVLARYMQILPPELCEQFAGRVLNIHHSFLPSFVGARPYHQAFDRGVKLIGATCHYVTADLDAGPIIEQDVIRVDHSDTPDEMMRLGRDVEKNVLARGLRLHLQDRVLVHRNKTIIFG
jgi:formyltetrahydrofolate deformylase